ncbi:hypothetical protein ACLOJK_000791 [Asimina triloba]
MVYARRSPDVFDTFTLSPLPYPVLFILAVVFIFLGTTWYFSYEDLVEETEFQYNWALFATPLLLILLVRWVSSMEDAGRFFYRSPEDRRRQSHCRPSEGSSPWGVAALIILLLVLINFQSAFLDKWFH